MGEGKDEAEPVPTVTFQFYERPPGSVFRASVAAVSCVLLVWLVGYLVERIDVAQLQTRRSGNPFGISGDCSGMAGI